MTTAAKPFYMQNPKTNSIEDVNKPAKKEEGQFENILTKMQNRKPAAAPVKANKKTWYFDTPQGVDHITKTLHDFTDIKPEDAVKMNKETKEALIKSEEKGLKPFDHYDKSSYPSDPEQRRRLTNIQNLEKSIGVRTDTWKRFVKTGAMPLVPKNFVSATETWDAIYGAMSPKEKFEFNKEQKTMENKRRIEEKQDKIKAFREKAALKAEAAAPKKKLAAEIVGNSTKLAFKGPNLCQFDNQVEDLRRVQQESKAAENRFKSQFTDAALNELDESSTGIVGILDRKGPAARVVNNTPLTFNEVTQVSKRIPYMNRSEREETRQRLLATKKFI